MNEFECGYINKPYCVLRPFNNCPSCPKFSCPPPLNCHNPCNPPFHNHFSHFPYCCPPHQDFTPPNCNPCQHHHNPCQPCQPFDCQPFNPFMSNLIWFYGGYRCGNKKSPCQSRCSQSDLFKNFIKDKIN